MAASPLRQMLNSFIESTKKEGILDEQFDHLPNQGNPYFTLEVITVFCADGDAYTTQVAKNLDHPVVDYLKMANIALQLEESSSSIGGCQVASACRDLLQACETKNWESCRQAYYRVTNEFYTLRDKLRMISQMEKTILTSEAKSQH